MRVCERCARVGLPPRPQSALEAVRSLAPCVARTEGTSMRNLAGYVVKALKAKGIPVTTTDPTIYNLKPEDARLNAKISQAIAQAPRPSLYLSLHSNASECAPHARHDEACARSSATRSRCERCGRAQMHTAVNARVRAPACPPRPNRAAQTATSAPSSATLAPASSCTSLRLATPRQPPWVPSS